ncbi:MAG: hypothetical protein CL946_10480 [Ectothiorhodospiraceae bacterium]|nr:hypothetical protein [Ectothiorhodospiraceae bacterium]
MRMPGNISPRLWWWLRAALGIAAIVAIGFLIDPARILQSFAQADAVPLSAALILLLPNLYVQFAKWRYLLRSAGHSAEDGDVLVSILGGFAAGILTPARIGEFGGRLIGMGGHEKNSVLGLVAVDKAATMLMTVSAGIIASAMLFIDGVSISMRIPAIIAAVSMPIAAIEVFLRLMKSSRGDGGGRLKQWLSSLMHGAGKLTRRNLYGTAGYSALFYAVFVLQYLLLVSAFGAIEVLPTVEAIAATLFAKTVIPPVTLGELGIREGLSVAILGFTGISKSAAFNAAFLLFCINVLIPALAGGVAITRDVARTRVDEV